MIDLFREREQEDNEDGQWIHPEDDPLLSSENDFKAFRDSNIWKDMKNLIEDRMDMLTDMLVYSEESKKIVSLQSEIKTLQDMLALPAYIEERCKIEKEDPNADS